MRKIGSRSIQYEGLFVKVCAGTWPPTVTVCRRRLLPRCLRCPSSMRLIAHGSVPGVRDSSQPPEGGAGMAGPWRPAGGGTGEGTGEISFCRSVASPGRSSITPRVAFGARQQCRLRSLRNGLVAAISDAGMLLMVCLLACCSECCGVRY